MPNILTRIKNLWKLSETEPAKVGQPPEHIDTVAAPVPHRMAQIIKRKPTIDEVIEKIINNG